MLLPWDKIDTILLDMDGTLLDLHFDNYFWLEYLPFKYAEKFDMPLARAKFIIEGACRVQKGKLPWYCVDHWSKEFDLPIMDLKKEIAHLIQWRESAESFLLTLSQMKKQLILVTNAHPDVLALKAEHIQFLHHFDGIISAHHFGIPKESIMFWKKLQTYRPFKPSRTLFIDDSITILRVAKKYGIRYLFGILQPDSHGLSTEKQSEFEQIVSYQDFFTI